ncbi:hypothetical protein Mpsy_0769 [Methanolobus psychrophilus R15]|nr:hypothetical protein Mpsy_0769 [Methanolobus psychrophilus R15]
MLRGIDAIHSLAQRTIISTALIVSLDMQIIKSQDLKTLMVQ